MNDARRFRLALATRLLKIAALAAVASPAIVAGCGGKVVVDGSGNAGGASGQGGTTDPTGSGTTTKCFQWPSDVACPSSNDAYSQLMLSCDQVVDSIGTFTEGIGCCYTIAFGGDCAAGRPFLVGDRPRTAEASSADPDARWGLAPEAAPAALSPQDRAILAAAWTRDALAEHASIASFARFSLELLAVGAPADLVAAAHEAAADEVNHARLCFALAGAYAGAPVAPSPFPFGGSVAVSADLAEVAASTVREGCIGETLAAIQAAEQLERAVDPAVRAALAAIAEDEARHAELAWRTVAWALATGGAPVRRAVEAAFAEARLPAPPEEPASPALAAHGRPGAAVLRASAARALADVVLPSARALLAPKAAGDVAQAAC